MNVNPTECEIHDNGPIWELKLKNLTAQLNELATQRLLLNGRGQDLMTKNMLDSEEYKSIQQRLQCTNSTFYTLEAAVRKMKDKCKRYERHLKQYATCRPLVKELEAKLAVGEALVYRDFVAQYMCDGKKINNLVLVVLWRETTGGRLNVFKLNHFCSAAGELAHDLYYVADVFAWYFTDTGNNSNLFRQRGIQRLFIVGDHGSHFSSKATVYN